MKQNIIILLLIIIVVGLPFLFRKEDVKPVDESGERLIIITPHNEAVRHEFGLGFQEWYFQKTGKKIFIDWRDLGGGKEVIKFSSTTYENAFKNYWQNTLNKEWNDKVKLAYNKLNVDADYAPGSLDAEVRDALVKSNITCGVDVLFGGGRLEISLLAGKGLFIHSGILNKHPEWFQNDIIPQRFGGNYFWEPRDLWFGTALSVFGIIFNRDALKESGITKEPTAWTDIAEPAYFGNVALADPTMSSSVSTAMEMILQQQMNEARKALDAAGYPDNEETQMLAVNEGWLKGMQVIQLICANARYFTDSSAKPVLDVASGNCAVGIAIDYYGLSHEENLRQRSGEERFGFSMPKGGSVVDPDPIAMLRGAPHPDRALAFIEYVLSLEGQKKWAFKLNTPGGADRYALRRSPIRKDLYDEKYLKYRSDPDLNFYRDGGDFVYNPEWTAPYAREFRLIIKSAFIDPHQELLTAWAAIIAAEKRGDTEAAKKALKKMQNFSLIGFDQDAAEIHDTVREADPLKLIQLRRELTNRFAQQYREAARIANNR